MTDHKVPLSRCHERFVLAFLDDDHAAGAHMVEPKVCDHRKPEQQANLNSGQARAQVKLAAASPDPSPREGQGLRTAPTEKENHSKPWTMAAPDAPTAPCAVCGAPDI